VKLHSPKIKYYRRLAGFSQKELAFLLGVSTVTIQNYESGKTSPSMETVVSLAHILSISTDQLLEYKIPKE